jgi:hypothetical protein
MLAADHAVLRVIPVGVGIERDQIVGFLERGSRQPLPPELAARLAKSNP